MGRGRLSALVSPSALVLLVALVPISTPATANTTCKDVERLKGSVTALTVHTLWREMDPNAKWFEGITRVTFSVDGSMATIEDADQTARTTVCAFDKQHRLVKGVTRSRPNGPESFDEDIETYKYSGRTTIIQLKFIQRRDGFDWNSGASTTYVNRDANGHIISAVTHYGSELWQRDFSLYAYFDDRIEEGHECGELDALCWDDIVYDLDGNMLSRKGSFGATMEYEFDARHNWSSRRELRRMPQEPPLEVVETREITYR